MKLCIIFNENAGSADQAEILTEAIDELQDAVCWRSAAEGDAVELAEQAAREGYDIVAAAGGDGTINEVVNGLMRVEERPALGVIPFGTGNDLARLLDVPQKDLHEAIALLRNGLRRRLDVYEMQSDATSSFGINAAAGGFSGQVNDVMTSELKANWGPLAYLIGAASVIPEIHDYDTYMAFDDRPPEVVSALNVVVANGRTVAGGKRIAPMANPEDGLLDIIIVQKGSVVEMGDLAARLVAGNVIGSRLVTHRRAHSVSIEAEPGMWFNRDGELVTNDPVTFSIRPHALEVIVGPDYVAEVAD